MARQNHRPRLRWYAITVALGLSALVAGVPRTAEADPPENSAARYDAKITPSDREHWAFQPLSSPRLPAVRDAAWGRNPIDRFVLAKLEEKGWKPAAEATPPALLRRVFLDVIGMPPTLAEQEAFLRDPSAEAFARLVDGLLARPGYGERWARHWLDLVRYAETNGYERDATKPHVWRFRDYVIRSINDDKPFDRFILEQLAGDEIEDATGETLVALGYYRLGPWDDEPADPSEDRFDQIDDMVSTTAQVFLGLTLGCARCHDHKFEPLTTLDYYRLVAVLNPLQRFQAGRSDLDAPAGLPEEVEKVARRERDVAGLEREIERERHNVRRTQLETGAVELPSEAIAAFLIVPEGRSDEQRRLVEHHRTRLDAAASSALPAVSKATIERLEARIATLRAATPDLPRGYFVHEPESDPPQTHVLLRGKASRPGAVALPGVPAVLVSRQPGFPAPGPRTSRRRLTLARWIASRENPLTARVIVNRVWQFHFGEGLVRTPSDFGVMGDPPTHPELLDWLADRFVADGWSLKRLHRLILSSATYRMATRSRPEYAAADPEDRLLWRVPYRRLDVEAIRDSMLAVGGTLNPAMFGPSVYPFVPREALAGHSDPGQIWRPFDEPAASRRTIYAHVKRSLIVPMLEVLDFCDTTKSAPQRPVTSVAPQALTLFNGDFVNRQARHLATRLEEEAGPDASRQIDLAFRLALCRLPTAGEREALQGFLRDESPNDDDDGPGARRKGLEQLCRVLFNLNEFVYPD